ncbi:MAG: hypothetical protein AAGA56_04990 [Myxococcota bacterium]
MKRLLLIALVFAFGACRIVLGLDDLELADEETTGGPSGSGGEGGTTTEPLPSNPSDGGGGTGGGAAPQTCSSSADCTAPDPDNLCQITSCDAERSICVTVDIPTGNAPQQPTGDCQRVTCDEGVMVPVADDEDLPDDMLECTVDRCDEGTVVHDPNPRNGSPCGTSGNGVCTPSGQCGGCTIAADCGTDNPCQTWSCDPDPNLMGSTICNRTLEPNGTILANQTPRDCQRRECNGNGAVVDVFDPTDVDDDGRECTVDQCVSGGVTDHIPRPSGTPCSTGVCRDQFPFECVECVSNADCDPNEECAPGAFVCLLAQGEMCANDQDCLSGHCSDNTCCDQACDNQCESCATAGNEGVCVTYEGGTDPENECSASIDGGPDCGGFSGCACNVAPQPNPGGVCPAACTGGCSFDTCRIDCTSSNCDNQVVNCPPGWACAVECQDTNACAGAQINCPDDYDCDVECFGGLSGECQFMRVNCSENGRCRLSCQNFGGGNDVCDNAVLECGGDRCDTDCDFSVGNVIVNCNDSCDCRDNCF